MKHSQLAKGSGAQGRSDAFQRNQGAGDVQPSLLTDGNLPSPAGPLSNLLPPPQTRFGRRHSQSPNRAFKMILSLNAAALLAYVVLAVLDIGGLIDMGSW